MIPPCRYCDGSGLSQPDAPDVMEHRRTCPRCEGSQLDEAWGFTFASERPGYSKVRIAYGAHAASRPLADVELPTEAADLLSDVLGGRIRRGLILRDKR